MKQLLKKSILLIFVSLSVSPAYAGNVGINLDLHVGDRLPSDGDRVIVSHYEPPYSSMERPRMVYADRLGLYVVVGIPYDMCYLQNSYYLFRDGCWYRGRSSRGPWVMVSHRDLPRSLRNQRIEGVRDYRYAWQRRFGNERNYYNGRNVVPVERVHFSGKKDHWREVPREESRQWQKPDREQHRAVIGWNEQR